MEPAGTATTEKWSNVGSRPVRNAGSMSPGSVSSAGAPGEGLDRRPTGPLMVGVHLPDPYIVVRLLPFHDLPFVPRLDLRLGPTVANIHPHDLQKTLNFKNQNYNQCCGSGMFIPDPDFYPSRIWDPGSKNSTATKEG
jgi:hypothetical protein